MLLLLRLLLHHLTNFIFIAVNRVCTASHLQNDIIIVKDDHLIVDCYYVQSQATLVMHTHEATMHYICKLCLFAKQTINGYLFMNPDGRPGANALLAPSFSF